MEFQKQKEQEQQVEKEQKNRYSFKEELKLLIPNRSYWVMQLLIFLNVGIYICMLIAGVDPIDPDIESLLDWGGSITLYTIGLGEYWRSLTACFLHDGLMHLLFNMYALLYVGSLLEKVIGHRRFLFAYILSGIFSSLVSCWWSFDELLVSVGASGAIFGMYGVYIALLISNKVLDEKIQKEMLTSMLIFVGYNLIFGLTENIDNAAHIGGLLFGMATGFCFLPALLHKGKDKVARYLIGGVVPGMLVVGMFFVFNTKDMDSLLSDWETNDWDDPALIYILEKSNEALQALQEIANEGNTSMDESMILRLEELSVTLQSCNELIKEYLTEDITEDTHRFLSYLASFTELKDEQLHLLIEYYHSGYDPEYDPLFHDLSQKMRDLESEYHPAYQEDEEVLDMEYDYSFIENFK